MFPFTNRKSYPDFDAKNGGAVGGEVKDGEEEDEEEEMDLGSCEMKEEGFELTLPSGKLAELSYPLGWGKLSR